MILKLTFFSLYSSYMTFNFSSDIPHRNVFKQFNHKTITVKNISINGTNSFKCFQVFCPSLSLSQVLWYHAFVVFLPDFCSWEELKNKGLSVWLPQEVHDTGVTCASLGFRSVHSLTACH